MSRKSQRTVKQRYESSPDVQRWLRDNTAETVVKPPFESSLLQGLRDRDWLMSSLGQFYDEDLIVDVVQVVKSGKEATVYCCTADPALGIDLLAAKVYRPRMFRNLRNDAVYRDGRAQQDIDGRVSHAGGRSRVAGGVRGRTARVSNWIGYEWDVQETLHAAGADVPRPIRRIGNAVLMEYVGDYDGPAPLLREVSIDRHEAQPLWDQALWNIEMFLRHNCIHGDLSAYNILFWQGKLVVIDFAQAVDPRHNPEVYDLLARDVDRTYRYFEPYGVKADPSALAFDMWMRYLQGDL